MSGFFDTPVEFLKGVGPQRSALLNKELNIFTFGDLIQYYPFRYEDRTKFYEVQHLSDELPHVQLKGIIIKKEIVGAGAKRRLVVTFKDATGEVELVWFQGIKWVQDKLKPGVEYVVFGKPGQFGRKFNIAHPEIEPATTANTQGGYLQPVYPLTEKLKARFIDSKAISKLQRELLGLAKDKI
ncbi:MAG TPA: OB-fold nucleic acid binding domain-containing protein, partial [Cyclobacteriaceae bacterium]|nr:OB-fold nucleic acid binding domain-containing protein [Cyclobacteriaceae bacterium]